MVIMPSGSRRATSTPALALRVSRSPPRQPQHAGDRAVGNPAGSVDVADPGHHNPRAGGKASGRERATRGPSPCRRGAGLAAEGITGQWAGRSRLPSGQEAAGPRPGRRAAVVSGQPAGVFAQCLVLAEIAPVLVSERDLNTRSLIPPPKTGSRRAGWPVDPTSRSGHTSVNLCRVESCTSTAARSRAARFRGGAGVPTADLARGGPS